MKQINTFEDKIVADLDNGYIKRNQIVFPTIGIRIFNKDGKGLIASVVPGNREFFVLDDGYVIIGAEEFEGIAFIFSHNVTTGLSEIGTYPAPNYTVEGFTKTYKPLSNLTDGIQSSIKFRTSLLNFNLHHPIDISIKKSYDNSIDLYIRDHFNPDRVLNSGFKMSGISNKRYVDVSTFDGANHLMPSSIKNIYIPAAEVQTGGQLKPGNYFIYVRYLTSDYAKTSFVKEIGPLSVSSNDTLFTHHGDQEMDWKTQQEYLTDKKIYLSINGLDRSFQYIQLAVVRYTSTTENGPAQPDVYLISQYYPINADSVQVYLTGYETPQILTIADVIKPVNEYKISKTAVQLESRLLRANLKKIQLGYNRENLIAFAAKIRISEFHVIKSASGEDFNSMCSDGQIREYAIADNVYSYVGYFKDQIYPYGIVFQFTDNSLSETFPCKGNIGNGSKGLYKFKDARNACLQEGILYPTQHILSGIQFDTNVLNDSAISYAAANPDGFKDVIGFYFVRADRIDNLICQGVMLHGYHGVRIQLNGTPPSLCSFQEDTQEVTTGAYTTKWNPANAAIMPLIRGYMPTVRAVGDVGYYGVTADKDYYVYENGQLVLKEPYTGNAYPPNVPTEVREQYWNIFPGRSDLIDTKGIEHKSMFNSHDVWDNSHGLFSPDLLFENNPDIQDKTYVQKLFYFSHAGDIDPYLSKPNYATEPNYHVLDLWEGNGIYWGDNKFVKTQSTFVNHLGSKGKFNFCGYFSGSGAQLGFDVLSSCWNRNIGTSRYVGIVDASLNRDLKDLYGTEFSEGLSVVNLYKQANDATFATLTNSAFNVATTMYSKISGLQMWNQISSNTTMKIFRGDCFLQKAWFRSHRWYAMENPNTKDGVTHDSNGILYEHGFMIGVVTEMKYNAGMRNEVTGVDAENLYMRYTFFPKCLGNGIDATQWTLREAGQYLQEAVQINAGYNKILSDILIKGYNITEPDREENKPNRVDASDKHIPGSFLDGYRSIQTGSYQDYAVEDGDIYYIGKNLSYAFIVQHDAINQIFINERAMGQSDQGQDIVMGASISFFSDKVNKIAWYGTQHKLSVKAGGDGTYGFDFNNRVLWMISTAQMNTGYQKLAATDLTNELLIQDEIRKLVDLYTRDNTTMDDLPEDPFYGMGIVTYNDPEFQEIGMTFLFNFSNNVLQNEYTDTTPDTRVWTLKTLVYSEKLKGFRGYYPFAESLYFNIGSMLFSQHHALDSLHNYNVGNKVYLYNIAKIGNASNNGIFFGNQEEIQLSFIVNGLDEKENASKLDKIYNSLIIESKQYNLVKIIYETQYQKSEYDFSTTAIWKKPEYLDNKWRVPVSLQTSPTANKYRKGSEMRGMWMKVTLVYQEAEDIEIKSVESNYDPSII